MPSKNIEEMTRDELISFARSLVDLVEQFKREIEELQADYDIDMEECREKIEEMKEFLDEKGLLDEYYDRFGGD